MSADKRKKGCPNELCEMNAKKCKQKFEIDYCPKCGTKLLFVCEKCFKEIEDLGAKHRICRFCEVEKKEKKDSIVSVTKEFGIKIVKSSVAFVTPIVALTANEEAKKLVNKGLSTMVSVAKQVIKK